MQSFVVPRHDVQTFVSTLVGEKSPIIREVVLARISPSVPAWKGAALSMFDHRYDGPGGTCGSRYLRMTATAPRGRADKVSHRAGHVRIGIRPVAGRVRSSQLRSSIIVGRRAQ